jgi:hypothetical protein
MFDVKSIIKLIVVLAIIALLGWGLYSITSGAKAVGTVKVIQQQGVANEEENERAVDAVNTGSAIATESDNSFSKRMQRYWASQSDSQPDATKGVQDIEHVERQNQEDGLFNRAETEAIRILQATGVLPAPNPDLLPCETVDIYTEDGSKLITTRCMEN